MTFLSRSRPNLRITRYAASPEIYVDANNAAAASAVVVLSVPVGRGAGSHAGGSRGHDGCAQPAPVWATRGKVSTANLLRVRALALIARVGRAGHRTQTHARLGMHPCTLCQCSACSYRCYRLAAAGTDQWQLLGQDRCQLGLQRAWLALDPKSGVDDDGEKSWRDSN